jgi:DNA mismatch repair protein MutL
MGRIRVLPDLLVNKIAAGEVIERPASVVKELMENSLDAGASHIEVEVEEGGRKLIRVRDDGVGMGPEDLLLAVRPHATSKIVEEDDLYHVATMGFRGEALASMGAVSHLRLTSRPKDELEGGQVVVVGEKVESSGVAGCGPGTTVEVRDLFFNVPARRKFLKTDQTEMGHVSEQFARLALAHPSVGFVLSRNGKVVHRLPQAEDARERIGSFFSQELAKELIEFRREGAELTLEGLAAPPALARSNTNWQYTFVNGRYVRDKFVMHAVKESYRGLLDPHRAPVIFLFLSINPEAVDVNVHPTKIEVRWANSGMVHGEVLGALRETFQKSDLRPALKMGGGGASSVDPEEQDRVRREMAEMLKRQVPVQPDAGAWKPAAGGGGSEEAWPVDRGIGLAPMREELSRAIWRTAFDVADQGKDSHSSVVDAGAVVDSAEVGGGEYVDGDDGVGAVGGIGLRALQVHDSYVVCETDEGLMIIDQHALHERVMYEMLKERMTRGSLESQRLLLPETLHVTGRQLALLDRSSELLGRLGIEISVFGDDAVAVQAFPALLKDVDVISFFRDLVDKLADQAEAPSADAVLNDLLSMMACKAAVKAGDRLTPAEIEALVAQRHLVDKSTNCPHGRPTMLRLSIRDLEREFKRT